MLESVETSARDLKPYREWVDGNRFEDLEAEWFVYRA
jgi:hypothetical protein